MPRTTKPASTVRRATSIPDPTPAPSGKAAPHLIVEARAGSGKTTTLVEGLKLVLGQTPKITPSPQQKAVWEAMELSRGKARSICFVAFNKSIAAELQQRVPQGVNASTMHSMGFSAVRKAFGGVRVSEYRVSDIVCDILQMDPREVRKHQGEMLRATCDLVGLCRMNLVGLDLTPDARDSWEEALDALARHYGVEMNGSRGKVFDLVPQVLARCMRVEDDKCIDFDDMVWLPVALDLAMWRNDLLLVDEAQDLNRCQQALAKKAGERLVLCGDPRQAIYGFAGADAESMPRMYEELSQTTRGCTKLPLTVTRRCGKAIVAEANKIVADFDAHETNCDGVVRSLGLEPSKKTHYHTAVAEGDMILCRVNAPLVSECFKFLKAGRKANIQGRDVGRGLISTITKAKVEMVPDLVAYLSDWLHDETAKELKKRNPDDGRLIGLQDRFDCLMAFTEGCRLVTEVIAKIEAVFVDRTSEEKKANPGILLSSVHKAKGLEADRVFILLPKKGGMPHPMAKTDWAKDQEYNLKYVAVTRAIRELIWVNDDRIAVGD